MEEIITLDGKQFKLTTDRPLTALERQQTIAQIRQQTGCSTCHQPRSLSLGDVDIYGLPLATTCLTGPKSEGSVVTLTAHPTGGVGPYYVNFWRMPSYAGAMSYGLVAAEQTIAFEGGYVTASFTIYDTDYVMATGSAGAMEPIANANGTVGAGTTGASLDSGSIRVVTTTHDSCPTGTKVCAEYCDVALACVAPTCNFVVT